TVIATSTLYRSLDEIRTRLAIRTIQNASNCGIPIVIVDGGSPEEVLCELKASGARNIFHEKGMGKQRRLAFKEAGRLAGESGVIVWMEPEKTDLIRELQTIAQPVYDGRADIVIARRSLKSLATYPPEQVISEQFGNLVTKYITELDVD